MFYDIQPESMKNDYKHMLKNIGSISGLFSQSPNPYLPYRAHENIFCRYFKAQNLARADVSADAIKDGFGIGLKTWVGRGDQKVAEFGNEKPYYDSLEGYGLVKRISEYRNKRISFTLNKYGLDRMIYHAVIRRQGFMEIFECVMNRISTEDIEIIKGRGNLNNIYFTDGKNTYHFSSSKNTLYMLFDEALTLLDEFPVEIIDDPYKEVERLDQAVANSGALHAAANVENGMQSLIYEDIHPEDDEDGGPDYNEMVYAPILPGKGAQQICLPLYSYKSGKKTVFEHSGLNQWNASGRERNPDELYIPYNKTDRERNPGFFPPRDRQFNLHLPDGRILVAKVCQDEGKAIMSDPNKDLGHWLLRDVLNFPEGRLITYENLVEINSDSVVFTKLDEENYSITFTPVGTYEQFYGVDEG